MNRVDHVIHQIINLRKKKIAQEKVLAQLQKKVPLSTITLEMVSFKQDRIKDLNRDIEAFRRVLMFEREFRIQNKKGRNL